MTCLACSGTGFIDVSKLAERFNPDTAFCGLCPEGDAAKQEGRKSPWPKKPEKILDTYPDKETFFWKGPENLEEFEVALDAGRAFVSYYKHRNVVWIRIVRSGKTKRFSDGKFAVKFILSVEPAQGYFLPIDLSEKDYPTVKIYPGEDSWDDWEDDAAAREAFGPKKLRLI